MLDRNVFEFPFVVSAKISVRYRTLGSWVWRVEIEFKHVGGYNIEGTDWDDLNARIMVVLQREEELQKDFIPRRSAVASQD